MRGRPHPAGQLAGPGPGLRTEVTPWARGKGRAAADCFRDDERTQRDCRPDRPLPCGTQTLRPHAPVCSGQDWGGGEDADTAGTSWSQLLPQELQDVGGGGVPVSPPVQPQPAGGPGHADGSEAEGPPYLRALYQQVLEGRPELSAEDLLQLPGQDLSRFPRALSGEDAGGLRGCPGTHLPWPHARRGQPASAPEPQAEACLRPGCLGAE